MSMVRIVTILSLLCAGVLPAFAWSTVRTSFDRMDACSAVSPFSSPRGGDFAVQAERGQDGVVRHYVTLKLDGRVQAQVSGRAELGLLLDGRHYGPFDVTATTTFGEVQYRLSQPPRLLIEQLKGAATATLLINNAVVVVRMSLEGSRLALTEWDACVAELSSPSMQQEKAYMTDFSNALGQREPSGPWEFVAAADGICGAAQTATSGQSAVALLGNVDSTHLVLFSAEIMPSYAQFGSHARVRLDFDGPAHADLLMRFGHDILGRPYHVVLDYPTDDLIARLKATDSLTVSIDGGAIVAFDMRNSRSALTAWQECLGIAPAATDPHRPEEWGEEAEAAAEATGPSFSCGAVLSPVEAMICTDDELASMDRALATVYASARERASNWVFVGDGPRRTAQDWFDNNARDDLAWREDVCIGKRACVLAWFIKRRAMMVHFTSEGFGDSGVRAVRQLPGNDTILSLSMAGHVRNTFYNAAEQTFTAMPSGDIAILNEAPLLYRVDWQKGHWKAGGAFWISTIRDGQHRIVAMATPTDSDGCMSMSEFIAKSYFTLDELARVPNDTVCYAS